jgi:hypothetical protein
VRADFGSDYTMLPPGQVVGGIGCAAIGKGTVLIDVSTSRGPMRLTLSGVLHCPDLPSRSDLPCRRLFSQVVAQRPSDKGGLNAAFLYEAKGNRMRLPCGAEVYFGTVAGSSLYALRSTILPRSTAMALAASSPAASTELWHRRLGHLHAEGMKKLLRSEVTGLDFCGSVPLPFCEACALGKSHVAPISRELSPLPSAVGELIGIDLWGPMNTPSLGGHLYAFGAVDYATSFAWLLFMRRKVEVPECLQQLVELLRMLGVRIARVRTDDEEVLKSAAVRRVCAEHCIQVERSAPYAHHQNGKVERTWRTLSEAAKTMLLSAGLGNEFWVLAMSAAVYIRNRVWSSAVNAVPYQLLHRQAPDLSMLRVFGCPAYAHVDKSLRRKFEPKAVRCIYVGCRTDSPAFLLWNPATKRVISSRSVQFDEQWRSAAAPGAVPSSPISKEEEVDSADENEEDGDAGAGAVEQGGGEQGADQSEQPAAGGAATAMGQQSGQPSAAGGAVAAGQASRYPDRERRAPTQWWMVRPGHTALIAAAGDPQSYREARDSAEAVQWGAAITTEHDALVRRGTWELVAVPNGRKVIGCKWVFKTKFGQDGSITKRKARLVCKGYDQVHGLDYEEVFAPTVKFTSIRLALSIAAEQDWEVEQLDVETAFLNAPVEEEIYMHQPEGFERTAPDGSILVCRLKKSLYGLKQSPRNWHLTLDSWLKSYGFQQSSADPGMYFYFDKELKCLLLVYVDDIIMCGPELGWIAEFKSKLHEQFSIQDLGAAAWVLGIAIVRDRERRRITLHQGRYIGDMLLKYNMQDSKAVSTPVDLGGSSLDAGQLFEDATLYKSLVGSLLYAAVATRPDIAVAVSMLSRWMAAPEERHWVMAKRVLRYLKGTQLDGLTFSGGSTAPSSLMGYCDADWAGDTDGRRSTTGYVFMLNGAAVSWRSQKQASVALSSTEAEYMGICAGTQEAMFLRRLMAELHMPQMAPTPLMEDNQSCIALIKHAGITHQRTKHIDIRFHFTRERVQAGDVSVEYCPTEDMVADVLTKALAREKHAKLCALMMGKQ